MFLTHENDMKLNQLSVSTKEVLQECSLTQFICILSDAAFKQQWQSVEL